MLRRYIEDAAAFEPEAIEVMGAALSDVCGALDIRAGDEHGREVIAIRNVDTLRDRILREARSAA